MWNLAQAVPHLNPMNVPVVWAFIFLLVAFFPIADYVFYSRLKSTIQIYVWNILVLWSLSIGCVWLIHKSGLTVADFGLNLGTFPRTVIVWGILILLIGVVALLNKRQKRKPTPEQLNKALDKVRKLLPVTSRERMWFVAVALTAGICEEFLYRGWLLTLLGHYFSSMWVGLIVSSICFGFAHAYQGRAGILSTGIVGIVFGLVFIASGSLLPGQILHAVMDLNNGLTMGKIAGRSAG
jgi:membrane protease YdiL (CAAX protease family)